MTDTRQKKYDDARKDTDPTAIEADLAAMERASETGDAINDRLTDAADEIAEIFNFHADKIRPFEAAKLVPLFIEAVNLLTGLDPDALRDGLNKFQGLDREALGELLLAMPITDQDETIDQHLAVDVARVIGPDHAQNWYRFAVLVTKLA